MSCGVPMNPTAIGGKRPQLWSPSMMMETEFCNAKLAETVVYEFNRFNFLGHKLRLSYWESGTFKPGHMMFAGTEWETEPELWRKYVQLEALMLHTRVLHDFFYKKRNPQNPLRPATLPGGRQGDRIRSLFCFGACPVFRAVYDRNAL